MHLPFFLIFYEVIFPLGHDPFNTKNPLFLYSRPSALPPFSSPNLGFHAFPFPTATLPPTSIGGYSNFQSLPRAIFDEASRSGPLFELLRFTISSFW